MHEQVLEAIQRDLATFADPGTEVQVTARGATWTQNRRAHSANFLRGDEEYPRIQFAEQALAYRSFFASHVMGDISGLAESIFQSMTPPSNYIDAPAQLETSETPREAVDVLSGLSTQGLPFGATRVVFVRGGAGAGKTVALKQLTIKQAELVVLGGSSTLFFYIDAQARALARLDEAVALLLQDLRASFTYRALATLTRLGLVVPIIDGFDELLGAGGYGEAFDSLAKFLARLDGRGSLIASARSTFYEYRDFRESANRYERGRSINFEIVPVDVLPWGDVEVARYLEVSGGAAALGAESADGALALVKERLGPEGQQFLRTPFFLATLVELVKHDRFIKEGERIVPQVILHFIAREKEKLRDRQDRPLIDEGEHLRFLEMLAEEMWWQGGRELDVATVKVIAELLAEGIELDPAKRLIFVERSPSYAFFESRRHEGRRFLGFTHEYYYSFFIGQFLARALTDGESVDQVLSRSRMSPLFGDEFAFAVRERGFDAAQIVANLSGRRVSSLTKELSRANAGTLFAGLIRKHPAALANASIKDAEFLQEDLTETRLRSVQFNGAGFMRCDLRGAEWSEVSFVGCRLTETIVDRHRTNLGGAELRVGESLFGLVSVESGKESVAYDPGHLGGLAEEVGIALGFDPRVQSAPAGPRTHGLIDLLKRFTRAAARLFYISDDDLQTRGMLSHREWPELERLLVSHGLMEFVTIQRRGPRHHVRRLTVLPEEIERAESGSAVNPTVARFWEALRRL